MNFEPLYSYVRDSNLCERAKLSQCAPLLYVFLEQHLVSVLIVCYGAVAMDKLETCRNLTVKLPCTVYL